MDYNISRRVGNRIRQFYRNVAKKYKYVYSIQQMEHNIDVAINSIYQIENGLQRREPTISRWRGMYMATSENRRWYFAYRIDGDTIYVEDACHSQNMHETKTTIRLTESRLKQIIYEVVRRVLCA